MFHGFNLKCISRSCAECCKRKRLSPDIFVTYLSFTKRIGLNSENLENAGDHKDKKCPKSNFTVGISVFSYMYRWAGIRMHGALFLCLFSSIEAGFSILQSSITFLQCGAVGHGGRADTFRTLWNWFSGHLHRNPGKRLEQTPTSAS